jgi:hypothetical protein
MEVESTFITEDGARFKDEDEAKKHEARRDLQAMFKEHRLMFQGSWTAAMMIEALMDHAAEVVDLLEPIT